MNEQHILNLVEWAMIARVEGLELFGMRWYDEAHNVASWLADTYNHDLKVAAGTMAVLSPGTTWVKNLIDTEALMLDIDATVSTYGRNRAKAVDILRYGDPDTVVSGRKVTAFYHNIVYRDSNAVTVDRHTVRTVLQRPGEEPMVETDYQREINTPRKHELVAAVVTEAARSWGCRAPQMQALTWCAYRRYNGQDLYDYRAIVANIHRPVVARWAKLMRRYE